MTSTLLHSLQAYPEWNSIESIEEVKEYIRTKDTPNPIIPRYFNARSRRRFIEKFHSPDWKLSPDGYIQYNPSDRINLVVAEPALRDRILTTLWNNSKLGLGDGIHSFYSIVTQHTLGITRKACQDFLQHQSNYLIHVKPHKTINKPILAKCPNERWEIDIFSLERYGYNANKPNDKFNINKYNEGGKYNYIFTVVDVFSHYVMAVPLLNLSAESSLVALRSIIAQTGTIPHIVQTDNGTSFSGIFDIFFHRWTENNPNRTMTHIYTKAYTPTSNGMVERMNQTLRNKIKAFMLAKNNLEWYSILQNVCTNINNQRNSSTGQTPASLWTRGYHPLPEHDIIRMNSTINDHSNLEQIQDNARKRKIIQSVNQLKSQQTKAFQVGDYVFITLNSFSNEFRKRLKDGLYVQYNAIYYNPEPYRIVHIYPYQNPRNIQIVGDHVNDSLWGLRHTQYAVENRQGQLLISHNIPRKFFGSELIHIPNDATEPTVSTYQRSRVINRFTRDDTGFTPNEIPEAVAEPQPIAEPIPEQPTTPIQSPTPPIIRDNPRPERIRVPNRRYM